MNIRTFAAIGALLVAGNLSAPLSAQATNQQKGFAEIVVLDGQSGKLIHEIENKKQDLPLINKKIDSKLGVRFRLPATGTTQNVSKIRMIAAHNCEVTPITLAFSKVRSRQQVTFDISKLADSDLAGRPVTLVVDDSFKPWPGTCRVQLKVVYKDANNKQRTLINYNPTVKYVEPPRDKCSIDSILSPDIDKNGLVTPTDVAFVMNRVGKKNSVADITQDGVVTSADVKSANERLGCKVPVDKCEIESLVRSPDFDKNGLVTSADVDYVMKRASKKDLSADLDNDGAVTKFDVLYTKNRIGCKL